MNSNLVASRYASAFLMQVERSGRGPEVYAQALRICADPASPEAEIEPDIARLSSLLEKNMRGDYLRSILMRFVSMYEKQRGIVRVRFTSACPFDGIEEKVRSLVNIPPDGSLVLETRIDPGLIGGFIIEYEDHLLDASVSSQIRKLKDELVMKTGRIV